MENQNKIAFNEGNPMAEKCPKCQSAAYCYGSPNASGEEGEAKIIHRYYACSNVTKCNQRFTIVSHFGWYIEDKQPEPTDINELSKRILSLDSKDRQKLLDAL